MHLSSSSAAGVRFLTTVREGRGLKKSAREAGIGKETGYLEVGLSAADPLPDPTERDRLR
jgi:hypothetical protein